MRGGRYREGLIKVGFVTAVVVAAFMPASAGATFPGDNGFIYFAGQNASNGRYDIWRVKPSGKGLKKLTHQPGAPDAQDLFDPSASRHSKRIAFTVGTQATSDVWIMHGDGSHPKQLTFPAAFPVQGLDQMPGISPDAKRIAFMTTRETDPMAAGEDYDIWTMKADGSNQSALLDVTGEDYFPEFTPNGKSVVMASEVSGDLDIASVTLAGAPHTTPATPITGASNLRETTPSVSPNGKRVAFVRIDAGGHLDVLSVRMDGSDEQPIADDSTINESFPVYSPDGKKIAYVTPTGIVIAKADGSHPKPLKISSNKVAFVAQLDWGSK
jgi:Tol biopolymer transport system component